MDIIGAGKGWMALRVVSVLDVVYHTTVACRRCVTPRPGQETKRTIYNFQKLPVSTIPVLHSSSYEDEGTLFFLVNVFIISGCSFGADLQWI